MRIALRKLSDERHVLAIDRGDGRREELELETRSCLAHDLLHFAVESEARLPGGFWGNLARGITLADMNDRTGVALGAAGPELAAIEQVVGALSGTLKGRSAADLVDGMRRAAASLGATPPGWLTEPFVEAVIERARRLMGHWRATPCGGSMELAWTQPPPA